MPTRDTAAAGWRMGASAAGRGSEPTPVNETDIVSFTMCVTVCVGVCVCVNHIVNQQCYRCSITPQSTCVSCSDMTGRVYSRQYPWVVD